MQLFGTRCGARKHFFSDGCRVRTPAATLADYGRYMARMGITRLADVTGLDRIGMPVCVAVRPNARGLSTSQGKGSSIDAARVSALMESIECWHAEHIDRPVRVSSARELAQTALLPPIPRLALRADAQWSDDRPIAWIGGEELTRQVPRWLPLDTVSANFVEWPGQRPLFAKGTNGLASGNHLLEAVVQALLEVIERDAVTLSSLRDKDDHAAFYVDPDGIDDPDLARLFDTFVQQGIAVLLEDVTSDLGVPVFNCTLVDDPDSPHWRATPKVVGHGCHLQSRVAVRRAVEEAVQSRVTMIAGSRDDLFPMDYHNSVNRDDHARVVSMARTARAPLRQSACAETRSFEDDIERLLQMLAARGIDQVIAVDLRHDDIGIPVVKIVVPGLEPVRTSTWRPGARARHALQGTRP